MSQELAWIADEAVGLQIRQHVTTVWESLTGRSRGPSSVPSMCCCSPRYPDWSFCGRRKKNQWATVKFTIVEDPVNPNIELAWRTWAGVPGFSLPAPSASPSAVLLSSVSAPLQPPGFPPPAVCQQHVGTFIMQTITNPHQLTVDPQHFPCIQSLKKVRVLQGNDGPEQVSGAQGLELSSTIQEDKVMCGAFQVKTSRTTFSILSYLWSKRSRVSVGGSRGFREGSSSFSSMANLVKP